MRWLIFPLLLPLSGLQVTGQDPDYQDYEHQRQDKGDPLQVLD
jgi:hypothetical protein